MIFGYTILYVRNVEETIHFYEDAFGIGLRFLHESKMYAELETGTTTLALAQEDFVLENVGPFTKNRPGTSSGFEIAFITEDVPGAYQRAITAGAHPLHPPVTKPWGQEIAYVTDCNGIRVELCTKIE